MTKGIRGATTASKNTEAAIKEATVELLSEMIKANKIDISKINPVTKFENISVTISLGVHQYKIDESEEELIKITDKALYEAKKSGRNKVITKE